MTPRPKLCILALMPVRQVGRVMRQIEYAAREYDVTVVGWGQLERERPHVHMISVERHRFGPGQRLLQVALMFGGRALPALWERWYWRKPDHRLALAKLTGDRFDLIHANEAIALPLAIAAARRTGAKVLFDAHEYTPQLEADKRWGRLLAVPYYTHVIRTYAPRADAMVTVCEGLAQRYGDEFGLQAGVVMNVPEYVELPYRAVDPANIRLIHHGNAMRDRRLESNIDLVTALDPRYSLQFMLQEKDPGYLEALQALAAARAPGRVTFRAPVPPDEISTTVNQYDISLALIPPAHFSYMHALPNKFFEAMMGGLALAIGPSPEMARIVRQHGLGVVADSFAPGDLAARLNALTPDEINGMKQHALDAARNYNAGVEMPKVLGLYRRLLAERGSGPSPAAPSPRPPSGRSAKPQDGSR